MSREELSIAFETSFYKHFTLIETICTFRFFLTSGNLLFFNDLIVGCQNKIFENVVTALLSGKIKHIVGQIFKV